MKKSILYIGTLLGFLLSSCDKDLIKTPYNGVSTEIVFNNPEDFAQAARGMYSGLRGSGSYLGGESVLFGDILSDNMIIVQSGRKSYQSTWQWNYSSNSTSGLYDNGYSVIRRANAILENINKLPDGTAKNNYKGEALAIRGMVHFDILRLFAKRYTAATENTDLGIPYVTSTDASLLASRSTMKDSYAKILADLTEAESLIATTNGVGRLNKPAVAGLLSRIYIYKNDFVNAGAAADRCLATSDNPGTQANLSQIFTDQTETGVLFKIKMLDVDNVKIGTFYSQTVPEGIKSEYVPTFDFFSLYQANDIRKSVYFSVSPYNGIVYNHVAKYLQRPATTANILDFKVLRTAEVLLNQAEAYAQNSSIKNEAKALTALDKLRSNRYTGFVSPGETGTALLNAIYLERRLELAFENDRFYDLKRRNVPINRDATHGEFADGSGTLIPAQYRTLAVTDKKWWMPFSQTAINVNTNLHQDDEWK